jgi:hypothetical protein
MRRFCMRGWSRRGWWMFLLAAPLWAQAPVRIVRGEITAFAYREGAGELSIRDPLYRVHRCALSSDTWFEYNLKPTVPDNVRVSMTAEVVADTRGGAGTCTALTVYLREAVPRIPIGLLSSSRSSFLDGLYPRGNLIYTGTVRGIEGRELILRTRKGDEQRFLLREDTVFQHEGRAVRMDTLGPQTRIHVRAGRNFEGRVEAYQITWGTILQPEPSMPASAPSPQRP